MALYTTSNRRLNAIIKSSKGASYTVGLITIFIVVLMVFLAILPAYRSITDQLQNNQAKSDYMKQLKDKKAVMDKLLVEYDNNKTTIDQFIADYPSKADNELMVANFSKIAASYNTVLVSSTFNKPVIKSSVLLHIPDRMSAIPINIVVQGKLTNLEKVLDHLDKLPIPFNVYSITYAFGNANAIERAAPLVNTTEAIFNMNISGEYYYFTTAKPTP